jgi:hypothetical protein
LVMSFYFWADSTQTAARAVSNTAILAKARAGENKEIGPKTFNREDYSVGPRR